MSEHQEKTDRGYDLMLMRLERWLDELAPAARKASARRLFRNG